MPQLLYMEMMEANGTAQIGDLIVSVPGIMTNSIITPEPNSSLFHINDVFTGEVNIQFTNSCQFYCYY